MATLNNLVRLYFQEARGPVKNLAERCLASLMTQIQSLGCTRCKDRAQAGCLVISTHTHNKCPLTFFTLFEMGASLYSSGCPETHSVDHAGQNSRDLPASASRVPG